MSFRLFLLLPPRLLLLTLVLLSGATMSRGMRADAASRLFASIPLTEKLKSILTFHSVEWDFESFQERSDDWGLISIQPDTGFLQGTSRHGTDDVYMNVVTFNSSEPVWVVDNMYIPAQTKCGQRQASSSSSLRRSRFFSLEVQGRDAKWLEAIVVASLRPIPLTKDALRALSSFPKTRFKISPAVINSEGHFRLDRDGTVLDTPGDVGPPPEPITLDWFDGVDPPIDPSTNFVAPKCKLQEDTPNVQCAINQCVPMAVANTLQWIEDKYGSGPFYTWELEHDHVTPGYGQTNDNMTWVPRLEESFFDPNFPDATSLIAEIDTLTERIDTTSFNNGRGSSYCQLYNGMFGYLETQDLEAVFRHAGEDAIYGEGGTCQSPQHGGRSSTRDIAQPTWDWMYQELDAGNGLFLVYGRYNATGSRTGGHVLRVQGACRYGISDYIYLLDDGLQGSNFNRLYTGLQVLEWKVKDTQGPGGTPPNGQLNLGSTTWEIEFAQSIRPILNSLPIQVSP